MSAKPGNAERDAVAIAGRPWDRQPNESPKAFEAFAIYRDMGVYRDQRAVALAVKKQRALLGRWSVTYEWVSRVSAWDAWNDAESRKLKEGERSAPTSAAGRASSVSAIAVLRSFRDRSP